MNFSRLLCFGGNAERKKHHTTSKNQMFFVHSSAILPSTHHPNTCNSVSRSFIRFSTLRLPSERPQTKDKRIRSVIMNPQAIRQIALQAGWSAARTSRDLSLSLGFSRHRRDLDEINKLAVFLRLRTRRPLGIPQRLSSRRTNRQCRRTGQRTGRGKPGIVSS
jgi:hypothetical protein